MCGTGEVSVQYKGATDRCVRFRGGVCAVQRGDRQVMVRFRGGDCTVQRGDRQVSVRYRGDRHESTWYKRSGVEQEGSDGSTVVEGEGIVYKRLIVVAMHNNESMM